MQDIRLFIYLLFISLLFGCNNDDTGLLSGKDNSSISSNNSKPEATNVAVFGTVGKGVTLQLTGRYFDADGDAPAEQKFRWLKDSATIWGENKSSYTITDPSDEYMGCVTPEATTGIKEGTEVCSYVSKSGSSGNNTVAPTANITISGTPLVGNTIQSEYTFEPNGGSNESYNSLYSWLIYTSSLPEMIQCNTKVTCELIIKPRYLKKGIYSCVIPNNLDGVYGASNCQKIDALGIQMTGNLEYGKKLTLNTIGFNRDSYTVQWKMNLDDINGPTNDNLSKRVEIPELQGGVGNKHSYQIGTLTQAITDGSNPDQIITDSEWNSLYNTDANDLLANPDYSSLLKDSNFFIGKDVTACINSTIYGDICVNASDSINLLSEVPCSDNKLCVVGGIYFDQLNPKITKRGVSPIERLTTHNGFSFYRALTNAEIKLGKSIGLPTNLTSSSSVNFHGINYANIDSRISYDDKQNILMGISTYCKNQEKNLPVNGFMLGSSSDTVHGDQLYADANSIVVRNDLAPNNNAIATPNASLHSLWQEFFDFDNWETYGFISDMLNNSPTIQYDNTVLSPTTGWASRYKYPSSSINSIHTYIYTSYSKLSENPTYDNPGYYDMLAEPNLSGMMPICTL